VIQRCILLKFAPGTLLGLVLLFSMHQAHGYSHFITKPKDQPLSTAHWPLSSLPLLLHIDNETIPSMSPLQLAQEAAIAWKQTKGSYLQLQVQPLPIDINKDNFEKEIVIGDKRHEIVIEQDGAILLSLGLDPQYIAGIGVPVTEGNPKGNKTGPFYGTISDAFIVINTRFAPTAQQLKRLLLHEIGHVLGLAHTNVAHLPQLDFLPIMFFDPTQQTGAALLHADDRAGLATLYPSPQYETLYGAIEGNVRTRDNQPAFGLAVLATSPETGPIGTWTDAKGHFRLTGLPPGKYTLMVRALNGDKDVNGMDASQHVGGIYDGALTQFCPEHFNDHSFLTCRFPSGTHQTFHIHAGQTITGVQIQEGAGNPGPTTKCVLGSAPSLPNLTPTLPPLSTGQRGASCPIKPEPSPEPQQTEPKAEKEPITPDETPDTNPSEQMAPVCGCTQPPSPGLVLGFIFLFALFLRRN
jgi:hypothetical protein